MPELSVEIIADATGVTTPVTPGGPAAKSTKHTARGVVENTEENSDFSAHSASSLRVLRVPLTSQLVLPTTNGQAQNPFCLAHHIVIDLRRCQNYETKGVNTLPKVTLRSDESPEQLLRRFSREVVKSRLLTDVRRKRWFVSKSELNRIAKKKAARRTRKSQKEQQQTV